MILDENQKCVTDTHGHKESAVKLNGEITLWSHFWSMGSFNHSLLSPMVVNRGWTSPKGIQLGKNDIRQKCWYIQQSHRGKSVAAVSGRFHLKMTIWHLQWGYNPTAGRQGPQNVALIFYATHKKQTCFVWWKQAQEPYQRKQKKLWNIFCIHFIRLSNYTIEPVKYPITNNSNIWFLKHLIKQLSNS